MRYRRTPTVTVPRLVAPAVVTLGVQIFAALWAAARRRQEAVGRLEAGGRTVLALSDVRA